MEAELSGEVRAILRNRRGVFWCPFCARSRMDEGIDMSCDGCGARFWDSGASPAEAARPRRRNRAPTVPPEAGV